MKRQLDLFSEPKVVLPRLKSATSLSGGKSSSYMALHYPTDAYLFAPVLTDDPATVIADRSLRKYCQSKVPSFDWDRGGSRELDLTLSNLRRLEQELGQEVVWVAAPFTYDQIISGGIDPAIARAFGRSSTQSAMLPNSRLRFCTETLKVYPIAWWLYLNGNGMPWILNIGFRADEPQRVINWQCDRTKITLHCDIQGRFQGKHRHTMLDYRMATFPMHSDGIDRFDVARFWQQKNWKFPAVSNCDFCFFHRTEQHRQQQSEYGDRAQWWIAMEEQLGKSFGKIPLTQVLSGTVTAPQPNESGQLSCFCHD